MENNNPINDLFQSIALNQQQEPSEKFVLIKEYFEKDIETKTDLTIKDINNFRKLHLIISILKKNEFYDLAKIIEQNNKYVMKMLISKYRRGRSEFVNILKNEPLMINPETISKLE